MCIQYRARSAVRIYQSHFIMYRPNTCINLIIYSIKHTLSASNRRSIFCRTKYHLKRWQPSRHDSLVDRRCLRQYGITRSNLTNRSFLSGCWDRDSAAIVACVAICNGHRYPTIHCHLEFINVSVLPSASINNKRKNILITCIFSGFFPDDNRRDDEQMPRITSSFANIVALDDFENEAVQIDVQRSLAKNPFNINCSSVTCIMYCFISFRHASCLQMNVFVSFRCVFELNTPRGIICALVHKFNQRSSPVLAQT